MVELPLPNTPVTIAGCDDDNDEDDVDSNGDDVNAGVNVDVKFDVVDASAGADEGTELNF